MDFLEMLRLRNVFGQNPTPSPEMGGINFPSGGMDFGASPIVPPTPEPTSVPEMDISSRMRELYSPETMATDRFNSLIGQMPRLQDYRPTKLGALGGGLMSLASSFGPKGDINFNPEGVEAGMNFMNRPFNEKFADWKNQMGPAGQAAQFERYQNANERMGATSVLTQERLAEKQKQDNEVREERARVYRWKAENPNAKFDFSGPTVLMADPGSGKVTDTGVKTGNLNDADKIELGTQGRIKVAQEVGSQQRQTEETRQGNRIELGWSDPVTIDDPDNPGSRITVQTNKADGTVRQVRLGGKNVTGLEKPGTGKDSDVSPTQQKVAQFLKARQLKETDPELGQFIDINPQTNDIMIKKTTPGSFFSSASGPTPEQRARINQAIFGINVAPVTSRGTPSPSPSPSPTPAKPAGGKIRVRNKQGKTGNFSGTREEAIAAGYTPL